MDDKKQYTVLVVDDDRGIRHLVELFLKRGGYNVITASLADEGLEYLQKGGVDLVIMDIMMPEKTGYQAIKEIQANSHTANIPVIMMTARAVVERTSPQFLFRTYGFLTKPFTSQALLEQVQNVLKAVGKPPLSKDGEEDKKADSV